MIINQTGYRQRISFGITIIRDRSRNDAGTGNPRRQRAVDFITKEDLPQALPAGPNADRFDSSDDDEDVAVAPASSQLPLPPRAADAVRDRGESSKRKSSSGAPSEGGAGGRTHDREATGILGSSKPDAGNVPSAVRPYESSGNDESSGDEGLSDREAANPPELGPGFPTASVDEGLEQGLQWQGHEQGAAGHMGPTWATGLLNHQPAGFGGCSSSDTERHVTGSDGDESPGADSGSHGTHTVGHDMDALSHGPGVAVDQKDEMDVVDDDGNDDDDTDVPEAAGGDDGGDDGDDGGDADDGDDEEEGDDRSAADDGRDDGEGDDWNAGDDEVVGVDLGLSEKRLPAHGFGETAVTLTRQLADGGREGSDEEGGPGAASDGEGGPGAASDEEGGPGEASSDEEGGAGDSGDKGSDVISARVDGDEGDDATAGECLTQLFIPNVMNVHW